MLKEQLEKMDVKMEEERKKVMKWYKETMQQQKDSACGLKGKNEYHTADLMVQPSLMESICWFAGMTECCA